MTPMPRGDRDSLIRIMKSRAKRAERDLDARRAFVVAEVLDVAAAEYDARDKLWANAVAIAEEAVAKANAQIVAECVDAGIPAKHAPRVELGWRARGSEFMDRGRRAELVKLAEARAKALHAEGKAQLWARTSDVEESLILGGLESDTARELVESLPTPESLLPALSLDDLGVKRWQPPEDVAAQLTTPMTPAQRRRRKVLRAIEANPNASDRKIAQICGVDHKTVAAARQSGDFPTPSGEVPKPLELVEPPTDDEDGA